MYIYRHRCIQLIKYTCAKLCRQTIVSSGLSGMFFSGNWMNEVRHDVCLQASQLTKPFSMPPRRRNLTQWKICTGTTRVNHLWHLQLSHVTMNHHQITKITGRVRSKMDCRKWRYHAAMKHVNIEFIFYLVIEDTGATHRQIERFILGIATSLAAPASKKLVFFQSCVFSFSLLEGLFRTKIHRCSDSSPWLP